MATRTRAARRINTGTLNIDGDGELGVGTSPLSFTGTAVTRRPRANLLGCLTSQARSPLLPPGFTAIFPRHPVQQHVDRRRDQRQLNLSKIGGGTLSLWAANTFSGVTTVNTGTLLLGNSLALQQSTLDLSGTGQISFGTLLAATLGGLQGTGKFSLSNTANAAVALTVGNNVANTTFSGTLSGTGSLTKTGAGTLTLNVYTYTSGGTASNYSGGIFLNQGTLKHPQGVEVPSPLTFTGNATLQAGANVTGGGWGNAHPVRHHRHWPDRNVSYTQTYLFYVSGAIGGGGAVNVTVPAPACSG